MGARELCHISNTLNLTINQRKKLSLKMGHNFTTNLQYGKNKINIDDID